MDSQDMPWWRFDTNEKSSVKSLSKEVRDQSQVTNCIYLESLERMYDMVECSVANNMYALHNGLSVGRVLLKEFFKENFGFIYSSWLYGPYGTKEIKLFLRRRKLI